MYLDEGLKNININQYETDDLYLNSLEILTSELTLLKPLITTCGIKATNHNPTYLQQTDNGTLSHI